jgi:hypothetical protein
VPLRWIDRRQSARVVPGATLIGSRRVRTDSGWFVSEGTSRTMAGSLDVGVWVNSRVSVTNRV